MNSFAHNSLSHYAQQMHLFSKKTEQWNTSYFVTIHNINLSNKIQSRNIRNNLVAIMSQVFIGLQLGCRRTVTCKRFSEE